MHCWHQAVRVTPARAGDAQDDIAVDTEAARDVTSTAAGWPRPGPRGRHRRTAPAARRG